MPTTVLLGYELATGKPVHIPLAHMVVAGQTQLSGKTTTLEALIGRSGLRAVTFVTKRAEGAFNHARRIPAYFKQYADWQSVSALLEAMLNERLKFERSWIMRACKGAQTLKDVQRNVEEAQREARRGLDENVYLVLSEYLRALVPEIEKLPYSDRLELKPGVNAIDISAYSLGVQSLVIRSVMEWIYKHERDTICLIPEAWEFIPQSRNSPVKLAAVQLTRKGAAAGNFVWLDSQDLAGVDKEILRQVGVWILGVQRQEHEVKRALEAIPAGNKRPKPADIMQLGRGWFYLSHGRELRCVYVQPAWLDKDPRRAQRYTVETLPESFVAPSAEWKAKQDLGSANSVRKEVAENRQSTQETVNSSSAPQVKPAAQEREMRQARNVMERCELVSTGGLSQGNRCMLVKNHGGAHVFGACAYEHGNDVLSQYKEECDEIACFVAEEFPDAGLLDGGKTVAQCVIKLLRELKTRWRMSNLSTTPTLSDADISEIAEQLIPKVLEQLKASPELASLQVTAERPEISVQVVRKVIDVDGSTLRGRTAQLIAEGWFDTPRRNVDLLKELARRGFTSAPPNISRELNGLAELGFLTSEKEGFQAVAGMKINIREGAA